MNIINKEQILSALSKEKTKKWIDSYVRIMNLINNTDASVDKEFQKLFNGFYRMRQRKALFYNVFYSYLQSNKWTQISFEDVLMHIFNETWQVHASFSSKLAHTINPNLPIWDKHVLGNMNLQAPSYSSKNRIVKIIDVYNKLSDKYNEYLSSETWVLIIKCFNYLYPNLWISDIKKVDFALWQIRDN